MIAAKLTFSVPTLVTVRFSFSTNLSSRPSIASISLRPALYMALFSVSHLGSSKPQILPAQPPASHMTVMPPKE